MFEWLKSKEKIEDDKKNRRLDEFFSTQEHFNLMLKGMQNQIDTFDIQVKENKKIYQKLLKERMEALKEEEEGSEEEGESEKPI